MSDLKQELNQALIRFVDRRVTTTIEPLTVTAVDENESTIDGTDIDGLEVFGVRLRAAQDNDDNGITVYPLVGSTVLIGQIGTSDERVVLATTVTSKVHIKVDGAELVIEEGSVKIQKALAVFEIDQEGTRIEGNSQSLKAALDALIDNIKLITVTSSAPGSPTSVPLNFAAFDVVKAQIAQILK